jgi:hypothetical protein
MTHRSKRYRLARYQEATELQTQRNGRRWPRRWLVLGPRVMPLVVFISALAKRDVTAKTLESELRGEIAHLEGRLARHDRLAARTQAYIAGVKSRLTMAENNGLSVAEFLELDRAGAREHWRNPKIQPVGRKEAI